TPTRRQASRAWIALHGLAVNGRTSAGSDCVARRQPVLRTDATRGAAPLPVRLQAGGAASGRGGAGRGRARIRRAARARRPAGRLRAADRKSTRLNSSHVKISYAVFCLKK